MRRVARAVEQWFAAPVTGASAGLFRIALGLFCGWYGLGLLLNVERYFSERGAVPWKAAAGWARWGAFSLARHSEAWAACVTGGIVVLGLLMAVGLLPRLMAAVLYYLVISVHYRNPWITSAADQLLGVLLFLAVWLPLGHRYSLDARLRSRLGLAAAGSASIWSQRLVQFQVAAVYLMTAIAKAQEPVWQEGQALRGFLAMPTYSTWPMWHPPWPFMKPLAWGTMAFELAFPLLVWFPPLRPFLLIGGILFHTGIHVMMQIPLLSALMIISYLMFIPDAQAERFVSQLLPRLPFGKRREEAAQAAVPD